MFFKNHKNKLQYLHRIQNNQITIINYMTLSLGIKIDGQLNWKEQIDEILLYRTGNAIIITVCYVFRCHAVIAFTTFGTVNTSNNNTYLYKWVKCVGDHPAF